MTSVEIFDIAENLIMLYPSIVQQQKDIADLRQDAFSDMIRYQASDDSANEASEAARRVQRYEEQWNDLERKRTDCLQKLQRIQLKLKEMIGKIDIEVLKLEDCINKFEQIAQISFGSSATEQLSVVRRKHEQCVQYKERAWMLYGRIESILGNPTGEYQKTLHR